MRKTIAPLGQLDIQAGIANDEDMDPATDLPPTGGVSNATTLEYVLRRVDELVREERAAVRELRLEIRHDHEVNEQRLELIRAEMRQDERAAQLKMDRILSESQARIDQLKSETQARIDQLKSESQARIDQFKSESRARMDQVDADSRQRMDKFNSESLARMDKFNAESQARIDSFHSERHTAFRWLIGLMVATLLSVLGLLLRTVPLS